MNSTFFGSFSKTTFRDLHFNNIRSYHTTITLIELLHDEIINIEDNFDIDNFKRDSVDSYLLCFATDHDGCIEIDSTLKKCVLLDCSSKDKNSDMKKNKDFLYVFYKDFTIGALCKPSTGMYYDDFSSISYTQFNDYHVIPMSETQYFDLRNIKTEV